MKRRFLIVGALACAAPAWGAYNTTPTDPVLQSQLGTGVWSALQKAVGSIGSVRLDDGSQPITQAQLGTGVWSALQTAVGSVGSFVVNGGSANVGIKTASPLYPLSIGAGTWVPTYFIAVGNSSFVSTTGSAPSPNSDPLVAIQKVSSYSTAVNHNPAFLAAARKETTVSGASVTALEADAFDDVGGNGSFVEGARIMAQSAPGITSQPQTEAIVAAALAGSSSSPANYSYLVAVEGEVDNFYADAPPPDQFNLNKISVSFVADSLVGTKLMDAGFMCNPFGPTKFQSCFFVPRTGVQTAAFASNLPMENGWTLDTAGAQTFVNPGASMNIAPGAGVLYVHESALQTIAVILIAAGNVTILGQTGSSFVVNCVPALGKIGACWTSGQPYKLINNTTGGVTFNITSDRLNPN